MRIRGLGRIRHAAEKVGQRLAPGVRVLLYHRVADLPFDPQWLAVCPARFEQQMRVLREKFSPISTRQLLEALTSGKMPRKAVLVTFDDGYADNYHAAKPILEKFEIPATVFVTTANIGGPREFWWDELERLLFTPSALPDSLVLDISGKSFSWRLDGKSFDQKRPDVWTALGDDAPTERHSLYRDLAKIMKELLPEARENVLHSLARWSGAGRTPRASHRAMTADELADLARSGLVEIGAHTVNHAKLSCQPVADQAGEIRQCKLALQEILGQEISSFSYPFGGQLDYSRETIGLLQNAGFRCAFSAMPHCVRRGGGLFELPRFFVRDWDGGQFARELSAFASQ